jgi:hypothetical protein
MLFDLDDVKKQFLHSYPLLAFNIEAPFAVNVKVLIGMAALALKPYIVIYYHLTCDLLASAVVHLSDDERVV